MSFGAVKTLGKKKYTPDLEASLALSAGKKLTVTPTVTGNRRQFTVMMNVRRHKFGVLNNILSAGSSWYLSFTAADRLSLYTSAANGGDFGPKRLFRDTEWFFLGVAYDTVSRTVKMVINDQEVDEWQTSTLPNSNYQSNMNLAGAVMGLGAFNGASGDAEVSISDFVILDGEVLTPAEMIAYRTRHIPFGDNSVVTTKKFDTAGTAERFYTLTSNVAGVADVIINDEGKFIKRTTAGWASIGTEMLPQTGLFQAEYELLDTGNLQVFVGSDDDSSITGAWSNYSSPTGMYAGGNAFVENNNGVESGLLQSPAPAIGQVLSIQVNLTARKFYYSIDGVPQTGDPASGTGGVAIQSGDVRLYSNMHSLEGAKVNFGQKDYAYPVAGYGPLKEPAKSDLKRLNMAPHYGDVICDNVNDRCNQGAAAWYSAVSNFVMPSGKYYAEFKCVNSGQSTIVGVASHNAAANMTFPGNQPNSGGMYGYSGGWTDYEYRTGGSQTSKGIPGSVASGSISNTQTLQVAVDVDTGKIWYGVNGNWTGDPSAGTGALHTIVPGNLKFAIGLHNHTGLYWNFGDSPFTHTPPAGFVGPASVDFDTLRPNGPNKAVHGASTTHVFSNNGLTVVGPNNLYDASYSKYHMVRGKYYAEAVLDDAEQTMVGIGGPASRAVTTNSYGQADSNLIYSRTSAGFYNYVGGASQGSPLFPQYAVNGDRVGIAVDLDSSKIWYAINGTWDGDPVAGTGGYSITPNTRYAFQFNGFSSQITWDFLATPPIGFQNLNGQTAYQPDLEYGPNGCQLLFENAANLGEVTAGNKINWTLTGIASGDQVADVPGDSFAVHNPLSASNTSITITEAGTRVNFNSAYPGTAMGSLGMTSGKWYWEVKFSGGSSANGHACGIATEAWSNKNVDPAGNTTPYSHLIDSRGQYVDNGTSTGNSNTFTPTVTIGIKLDCDANTISYYKDNVLIGTRSIEAGQTWYPLHKNSTSATSLSQIVNFGQKPFTYTPPTGFKALRASTLPTPKYHGRDWFNVLLHVGTSAVKGLSGAGFTPDLYWGKARSSAFNHRLLDRVRGASLVLSSSATAAESNQTDSLISFDADGVTLGADPNSGVNQNGVSYVNWLFRAGGAPVANNDGTIPCMVSVAEAGHFSIVSHVGTGSAGTIGHGLPGKAECIISKNRDGGYDWGSAFDVDGVKYDPLYLNLTMGEGTTERFGGFSVDTVGLANQLQVNRLNDNYIHYLFRSVPGLCKVGGYTGNGSVDGPFVHCGFKPRWILYKVATSTASWALIDTARQPINNGSTVQALFADLSNAETANTNAVDLLSNGFKPRATHVGINASGQKYIYLALAEEAGGGDLPWPLAR
ncbi:DUF7483 domain-containing protein [Kiloniella laminariae]|uniref:DUF7483 domain-containing protein n=1 Tax=Kiloniella laminariae TaxID=454162 RepID=UPI0003637429|nr:SPRY domain-containing protein [Kiloniella laminariae]